MPKPPAVREPEVRLAKYDALRRALAEAASVDEVLRIKGQAEKLAAYSRIAEDKEAEADFIALRMRAVKALGLLLAKQREALALNKGAREKGVGRRGNAGYPTTRIPPPTLDEVGIDKNLAHQARRMASVSDEEIERRVEMVRTGERPERQSRKIVYSIVNEEDGSDGSRSFILSNIRGAIEAAKLINGSPFADEEVVAAVRRAVRAWTACLKNLEERHG